MTPQTTLLEELAREQATLADLDRQRERATARILALRERVAATAVEPPLSQLPAAAGWASPSPSMTSGDKLKLFRALFRGRMDVFPRLWVNTKKGTKGYAPACANEWKPGVCEKPKVKCGECPSQAFIPVDDQIVLDHLRGRHVIGAYPMLEDDSCWFLAADFDERSWKEDVTAFVATCRSAGLPVAVERSRSGQGAHVWFFFASPVPATVARKMGCYLVTEAMARRHQLGMESYDRFFPSQDTMPRGGFGNLIALPFQDGPRTNGNTLFVDDQFVAHRDQWAHLASLSRIAPATVEAIAREPFRRGQVIGVRSAAPADDVENATPWARLASGPRRPTGISSPCSSQSAMTWSASAWTRAICHQGTSSERSLRRPRAAYDADDGASKGTTGFYSTAAPGRSFVMCTMALRGAEPSVRPASPHGGVSAHVGPGVLPEVVRGDRRAQPSIANMAWSRCGGRVGQVV